MRKKKRDEEDIEYIELDLDVPEDIDESEEDEVPEIRFDDEEEPGEGAEEDEEGSEEEPEDDPDGESAYDPDDESDVGLDDESGDESDDESEDDPDDEYDDESDEGGEADGEDAYFEEDEEHVETEAERAYRRHKLKKKIAVIAGSIIGVLVAVYIGIAVYFGSHFIFRTTVNGADFSMKNVSQVEEYMKSQVAGYVLTIEKSDGTTEEIAGSDIALEYVPGKELEKLVKGQENFLWPKAFWEPQQLEASVGVKYDEAKLAEKIGGLACLVPENQTPSVDAHPEFKDTEFVIVPEVIGTQIDTEKFNSEVANAINGFVPTLNITEAGCYLQPRFVEDSPEVIAARDAMNSYLGASITYDFNPNTEVVDASVISQWVIADADMNVTFNAEAVQAYVASLAEKYNTKGKARQFTTATGNVVTVEGGGFGWRIDQEAEYAALTANIQNGETVTREPAYSSRGASHGDSDVGSTYAEVDLSNQHMYFIQNGQIVLDSPVVTGNPNKGNATPQGTYSLSYKTRNAVLRGDRRADGSYSYETPVAYWMPFNGGIGFHDATWQSSFGGSRYKTNGSHGCVNMPKDKAAKLYELIPDGCPVVCHY